jgi:hypothetical protein
MALVAGIDSSSSSQNTRNDAITYRKASAVLLLVSLVFSSLMVVFLASRHRRVIPGDRIIIWCILASLPFLFVRVIYYMLLSFDYKDRKFNPLTPNIYVQSFMQALMEFIAYSLFLIAGVSAQRMNPSDHPYGQGLEIASGKPRRGFLAGYNANGQGEPRRVDA